MRKTLGDITPLLSKSRILTLVFTDLADSVALKTRLGDAQASVLINEHFTLLRGILNGTDGREVTVTGDGCFLIFEAPSSAVEFALSLQKAHNDKKNLPAVRIGLHVGEVTISEKMEDQHRRLDVEGLAVDIAARIQNLAAPGQILLSYPVFDNARQRLTFTGPDDPVEWRAHGKYIFKGSDTSLDIYEVGFPGISPFLPPTGGNKAHRDVAVEESDVLGWRPATGLELPGRPNWLLTKKLGEGGFGDVWLVEHRKTRESHVVKFCYAVDRLRALKREVTLFRIMKENLGNREDIARIFDYQFDNPPYYLEMEYGGPFNLLQWLEHKGDTDAVPVEVRTELVARVAEAVGAAHSVGVLHKDIKPSNILVKERPEGGAPDITMIDFGVGTLDNIDRLKSVNITAAGMTELNSWEESHSGTRIFMAPELVEGKSATTQTDIYALGVLLYQLVAGRLDAPISIGWERDIADPLIREDISACVDGNPDRRLKSAQELAERLRALPARRDAIARETERKTLLKQLEVRRKRTRFIAIASASLLILIAIFSAVLYSRLNTEKYLRANAENARNLATEQTKKAELERQAAQKNYYTANIALAQASLNQQHLIKAEEVLYETSSSILNREWGWMLSEVNPDIMSIRNLNIFDARFSADGTKFTVSNLLEKGGGGLMRFDSFAGLNINSKKIHNRLIWNIITSNDGKKLLTVSNDNTAKIVDAESLNVLTNLKGHTYIVRAGAFSPDDTKVLTVSRDRTIRLWDVATGEELNRKFIPKESFTDIKFTHDGKYFVTASLEGEVRITETETFEQVKVFPTHPLSVNAIHIKKDGTIITGSLDRIVRFLSWDRESTESFTLKSYPSIILPTNSGITAMDFSESRKELLVGQDHGTISGYNTDTLELLYNFNVDMPLWKVALSPDNNHILTVTRWSTRLVDKRRFEKKAVINSVEGRTAPETNFKLRIPAVNRLRNVNWHFDEEWHSPSGLFVVNMPDTTFTLENHYNIYSPDYKYHVRVDPVTLYGVVNDVVTSRAIRTFDVGNIMDMKFSNDGKRLGILYADSGLVLYDAEKGFQSAGNFSELNGLTTCLEWTPNDKYIAAGTSSGNLLLLDAKTLKVVKDWSISESTGVANITADKSGKYLAVAGVNDRVRIFDLITFEQVSVLSGHSRNVIYSRFVDDGNRILTVGEDRMVKLWDVSAGRELVTLFQLQGRESILAAAICGDKAYAICTDKTVRETEFFPWDLKAYGTDNERLQKRVELWKRQKRLNPNLSMKDLQNSFR